MFQFAAQIAWQPSRFRGMVLASSPSDVGESECLPLAAEGATGPRKRSGKRTATGPGISGKPGRANAWSAPTEKGAMLRISQVPRQRGVVHTGTTAGW
jgi:hypothetical protein